MVTLWTVLRNTCYLSILFVVASCAHSGEMASINSNNGIETGNMSSVDRQNVYQVMEKNGQSVIAEMDMEDVSFDVPEEVAAAQEAQWKKHQAEQAADRKRVDARQGSGIEFFRKMGSLSIFSLFNKKDKERSSMAIAFQNALSNGNMIPAGMLKEKSSAASAWNQDLTMAVVFGGIAIVSLWTAWILYAVLPFPGNLIAFLIFLGVFVTFGILGILRLVEGLN